MTTPPPTGTDASPPWGESPRLKVCRLHPSGVMLDVPFTPPAGSQVRVGTFWPESRSRTGWVNQEWDPGPRGRGFTVPHVIELADIIGFAADATAPPAQAAPVGDPWRPPDPAAPAPATPPEPERVAQWWGYLHALENDAVILRGPYPDAFAAYVDAQQALLARVHTPSPPSASAPRGPGTRPSPAVEASDLEPAQPPAAVSVHWAGTKVVVGDPDHGWLHVAADDLAAALALDPAALAADLRAAGAGLTGGEPPVTLAALTAIHLPEHLPDITATPPPPPPALPAPPPAPTPTPTPAGPASDSSTPAPAAAGDPPAGTAGPAPPPPAAGPVPNPPPSGPAGPDLPGPP